MTALQRTKHGPFLARAAATEAGAGGAAGGSGGGGGGDDDDGGVRVVPVVEAEFGDAARLLEAIEEAGSALAARGGGQEGS